MLAELRALKAAQPALFVAPIDEDRDMVPAICEALNRESAGISSRPGSQTQIGMLQTQIGILLDTHEMLIPTNFLHLLPQPLPLLLFQSTGRSPQSFFPYHKHHHSLPSSPLMLCNDFSTSPSLKHRQILLGRGAMCTLLAKRLLCFQNAVAVGSALNHARAILLRGLSTVLRDAQASFSTFMWLSLPYFYVRVVRMGTGCDRPPHNVVMLEVKPGDSIENVMDRIIATTHMDPRWPRQHEHLIFQGRRLDLSKRVCDCGFVRPHSTLIFTRLDFHRS